MVTPQKPLTTRIVEDAIEGVFIPATQRHIAEKLPAHLGLEDGDWLARVIREMEGQAKRERITRLEDHERLVEDGEAQPEEAFETDDFRTLIRMYPDAFSVRLRSRHDLFESIQKARNAISHSPYRIELTDAKQALATCVTVLDFIKDKDAVNRIEERQNQLNNLDSADVPNRAEQGEGPHDAQPEGAPNLAGQDEEPRDALPEGAPNLAGQDEGPPTEQRAETPRGPQSGGRFDLVRNMRWWHRAARAAALPLLVLGLLLLGGLVLGLLLFRDEEEPVSEPQTTAAQTDEQAEPKGAEAPTQPEGQQAQPEPEPEPTTVEGPKCDDIANVKLTGSEDSFGPIILGDYCGDDLTFIAESSDNDIVSAAVAGDSLTLTAGDGSGGTATITVTATDPDGRSDTTSFDVTVNLPPDCDDVEDVTVVEGDALEILVSCSDLDGDTIALRVSAESQTDYHSVSPDTARIDGQGAQRFTITGLRSSVSAGDVEIEADDGKGGTDMVRFGVVVNAAGSGSSNTTTPQPERPDISIKCSPQSANKGDNITCSVSGDRGGPIEAYAWSARGGSPSSGSEETYSPSFGTAGDKTVSLRVSNDGGDDSASTSVQVVNRSPERVGSISNVTLNVGDSQTINVSGNFRDLDTDDRLTYNTNSSNSSTVRISGSNNSVTVTGASVMGGRESSATITVTAEDPDGATATQIFTVTVRPKRPNIRISCTERVMQGDRAHCEVEDNDGGPIEEYAWSARGSSSSNDSGETYRPSFGTAGTKEVSLRASNDGGDDDASAEVQVLAAPPSSHYSRCGSDDEAVYWFNRDEYTRHHVTAEAGEYLPTNWWGTIGWMEEEECKSWGEPGPSLTPADYYSHCGSDDDVYWFDRTNRTRHYVSHAIGVELDSRLESNWWDAISKDHHACEWPPPRYGELRLEDYSR